MDRVSLTRCRGGAYAAKSAATDAMVAAPAGGWWCWTWLGRGGRVSCGLTLEAGGRRWLLSLTNVAAICFPECCYRLILHCISSHIIFTVFSVSQI